MKAATLHFFFAPEKSFCSVARQRHLSVHLRANTDDGAEVPDVEADEALQCRKATRGEFVFYLLARFINAEIKSFTLKHICGRMSFPDGFLKLHLQAQLVKDRHSLVRMGSLYSDEEEEVLETPPEKVQMTWTRERCEAEKINKRNAPENFRELMSLKPSVNFHKHLHLLSAPVFNAESSSLPHLDALLTPVALCSNVTQRSVQREADAHCGEAERGDRQQIP